MSPPIPARDAERLAVLHAHRVLDTPPEADFDDLAQLASHICQTPIALITLVDRERQWFKARVGLNAAETPREHSFCAHAICEPAQDLFVVNDATRDPRFAANPLVLGDPNIRFYAGTPLVTPDGWALGTLCVIDRLPRELNAEQAAALRMLRRHVVNALSLRRLVNVQQQTIQELHEAQARLNEARHAAIEATEAKSRFLATMSHEIRTPMNAVIGMTTLLQATPLDSEQQDCIETIRTSGEMLLTLINDILDFSKIESGRLELEQAPFDLRACAAGALDLVAALARKKQIRLVDAIEPGVPARLVGDVTRLRQVLLNLLSNAVKFTSQGEVTLAVAAQTTADGGCELHGMVRDTGIGIPADRLDRLFQPYAQADVATTRHFGGTGLGLAISKRLVELMGGRMWVESTEGRGSTFHFTLRAKVAAQADAKAAPPLLDKQFAAQHPARILVADDNPVNRKVAVGFLQRLGYEPAVAPDGHAALAQVQAQPCDLVFMDDEMPGMSGSETTAAIRRAVPVDRQPVIVALTAHALVGDRERFLAAGMDEYLTKPLRLDSLTALLRRLPELRARLNNRARG